MMRGAMGRTGFDLQRAVIKPTLCAVLRRDALAAMAADEVLDSTWGAWLGRLAGSALGHSGGLAGTERGDIREPENRAHVRLGMTAEARAVLCAALGPGGLLRHSMAEAGLSPAARLVELSVMIVMPGAVEQSVHADVPPHINHPMATMWLALQDVPALLGPTMVHSTNASQLSERERWSRELHAAPREPTMTTYGPDGSPEMLPFDVEEEEDPADEHLSVPELLGGDVALPMLMDCGDAVLLDTRIFHYGSANTSTTTRAQLRATYATPTSAAHPAPHLSRGHSQRAGAPTCAPRPGRSPWLLACLAVLSVLQVRRACFRGRGRGSVAVANWRLCGWFHI